MLSCFHIHKLISFKEQSWDASNTKYMHIDTTKIISISLLLNLKQTRV